MFTGKTTSNPQDVGPKDLMVVLLSDLKSSVSSTKPSNYTISSLLGRLFLSFHICFNTPVAVGRFLYSVHGCPTERCC
jgi:hypothetical protein